MSRRSLTFTGIGAALKMSAVLLVPVGVWSYGNPFPRAAAVRPPPSIAVIQSMSELATTRVHISDFIEGENQHFKGKWILHGELLLGVDLSKAVYVRVDPEKRQAVLSLPAPHLISTKVDHERSDEVYVKAVSWLPLSGRQALRDDAWRQGDRKLQRLGQDVQYMEQTRVKTERVLAKLFDGLGWRVTFEWQEGPSTEPRLPTVVHSPQP